MTINGDFTTQTPGTVTLLSNGSNNSAAILNIGGSVIVGVDGDITSNVSYLNIGETTSNQWGGWGGPKNVTIGGDIIMYELGKVSFNVNLKGRTADYSNPDIDVKGLIRFEGNGSTNPNLDIINASNPYTSGDNKQYSIPVEVVLACNGITGNGVISNNSKQGNSSLKKRLRPIFHRMDSRRPKLHYKNCNERHRDPISHLSKQRS